MELGFLKDNPRSSKAMLTCAIGLAGNFILASAKIFAGWSRGFLSVMGDGFNNLTDMGSIILLMMTFYYVQNPRIKSIHLATGAWNTSMLPLWLPLSYMSALRFS